MKKPSLAFVTAFTLVLLFALGCKKEQTESSTTDTASTTSSVAATDTSATTATAATQMATDDQTFIQKAATGGMAEVSLGQQVSPAAKNADAKSFADKMVADHGKANDELKQLAATKGVTLPTDTDQEHKDAAQKVMSSKDLDKAYIDEMVKDHDQDVKEFEDESKSAKDADLRAWIDKTLPVLKEHQKMAHDIKSKMK